MAGSGAVGGSPTKQVMRNATAAQGECRFTGRRMVENGKVRRYQARPALCPLSSSQVARLDVPTQASYVFRPLWHGPAPSCRMRCKDGEWPRKD